MIIVRYIRCVLGNALMTLAIGLCHMSSWLTEVPFDDPDEDGNVGGYPMAGRSLHGEDR